jgi:hypothetical protein
MKINWYSALKKSTIGLFLFYIGLVFSQATSPDAGSSDCVCEEPMNNVWYKLSTGEDGIQRTIKLDMQKGKSYSEGPYYILELRDADNGDIIFVAFPTFGPWDSEIPKAEDPFLDALDKEFKNLEDYLRAKQGTEIKKQ